MQPEMFFVSSKKLGDEMNFEPTLRCAFVASVSGR